MPTADTNESRYVHKAIDVISQLSNITFQMTAQGFAGRKSPTLEELETLQSSLAELEHLTTQWVERISSE